MRKLLLAVAFAATLASVGSAAAQDWPTRPVTMVVTVAAGSSQDVAARILALRLSELLGQQVVVENVGGAGGMTGASRVAKAAPDGYQFVLGNIGTHAMNQALYKNPLYNAATDFAPVGLIFDTPLALIARKDLPVSSLQEFIGYTKVNQAKMRYGSPGAGSSGHLACALLNATIGVNVTHVPYRGGAPAMQDLIAGRIDYQCAAPALSLPHIEDKQVKAIAILTKNRTDVLPTLASAHEQGLTDFEVVHWNAFFLPKGTPAAIIKKFHDAAVAAMETPSLQERMKEIGNAVVVPERRSAEYLQNFVVSEIEKWTALIHAANIKGE
jgi:tripartite-type tricarboxylate transporter receptor subunit TctC